MADIELSARRRRVRVRLLSIAGSAALIAAAMWSASAPDQSWFAWLQKKQVPVAQTKAIADPIFSKVAPQTAKDDGHRRLHLIATAPGRNASEGTAQIGVEISSPLTFGAGAMLENGVVLKEIYNDHVLLERDGKTTLLFVEGVAIHPSAKMSAPDPDLVAVDTAPKAKLVIPPSPPTYTDILRGAPHYESDRLIGFDVYPGTSSGQFYQLGLQPGDLITSIDGSAVDSQEALASALKNVSEGRSVIAIVERKGKTESISLDGSVLVQSAATMASATPAEP
jgi:hypothetical protein